MRGGEDDAPPCERCGGKTKFVMMLPSLQGSDEQYIYQCESCQHHSWEDNLLRDRRLSILKAEGG
jgi:hypothetical protein